MQHQSKVLIMIAALGLCASATPAAADRIAILSCSLIAQGGPAAISLQIAGQARQQPRTGIGIVFQSSGSSSSISNVTGRTCAEVLADLANDGFEFRSSSVSGRQLFLVWESN